MSNNEKDEIISSKRIGPGDLLSFGSINLLFTLNLEKDDIYKYNIKWKELKSLNNLNFLIENKSLWKKVELSSTNDTINILIQINQSSKKLIKIAYVGFKRITYKNEQVDFYDFIETVTKQNGIYITSCDVCKCIISIQLLLKYKNSQKRYVLLGVSTPLTKEEKEDNNKDKDDNKVDDINKNKENINNENENNLINDDIKKEKENKSEEEDQDNPLSNITDDVIMPGEYNYIYCNLTDYTSGEFKDKIKIEHLHEFFQNIKVKTKSKIILNLKDGNINRNDDNIKDLLSITDMFIFYNKNKLYDILKQIKEEEDQSELKRIYDHHFNEARRKLVEMEENKEKEKEYIENYKNFLEKERISKEKRYYNTIKKERVNIRPNIYLTQNSNNNIDSNSNIEQISQLINISENNQDKIKTKNNNININKKRINTESSKDERRKKNIILKNKSNSINIKNLKIKLYPIKSGPSKPLNKKDMFEYFKYGICDKDPQKKSQDKVALVLDEFKKIFFVKCNKKEEKPSILDFDLNLFPQMNLRNMNDILESKKLIQTNFNNYTKAFFGTLLSNIVSKGQEGCEENSLFLSYLMAMNTIKKMVEIQKYNLPMPKNKDFFSPTINKGEIKKLLTEANQRRKEKLFVLDGNTKNNIGIKPYNPLLDKNLASFFSTKTNQLFLKINGFIGKNGEIMYDPLYRDTFQNNHSRYNKNNIFENKILFSNSVEKNNKNENKNHLNKTIKYKSLTTNRFLFNFKKNPGYSIYNESGKNTLILPFISSEKRKKNNFSKYRNKNNNKNQKGIKEYEEISKIISHSGNKSKRKEDSK